MPIVFICIMCYDYSYLHRTAMIYDFQTTTPLIGGRTVKFSQKAIRNILAVAQRLDAKGILNAIEGNISVLEEGLVYITPSGKNKAFLTEDMIAILDMDGNQVGGSCKASSEYKLHLHAYQSRPDIGGMVHAHTPFLTAHALCGQPIRTNVYPEMIVVFGSIEVAGYGRPGTDDIYREVGPLLQKEDVILLENHGAMAVGKTVFDAMNTLEAAEASARILTLTKLVGTPHQLPDEECRALWLQHEQRRQS